jgi:hypothetical protein
MLIFVCDNLPFFLRRWGTYRRLRLTKTQDITQYSISSLDLGRRHLIKSYTTCTQAVCVCVRVCTGGHFYVTEYIH